MARLVDQGVTKLAWVPGEDGIADINAPTVTELTATGVIDLTCLMVTTYEVRFDGSDTTSERAVCDTTNVNTPTIANYMGRLDLFRAWDTATPGFDTDDDVLNWATYKDVGYFVRRLGFPHDQAFAAADVVGVYLFMLDNVQVMGGAGSGFLKATVPLLQQGAATNDAVVAGP